MTTTYSIKLVNHTQATARLQTAIRTHLQDLFTKAFEPVADGATVQWGMGLLSDSVVIHVVDDIASSYIQQRMGGNEIRADGGGHTRNRGNVTLRDLLAHQWPGWSNKDMHAKGSLAASPPQEPLSSDVAELRRRGLSMKNAQLL